MKNKVTTIKYFLYARKSSESEDRQVLSIDSQIGELKKIAQEQGIKIVDVLSESKSAKEPGRLVFNEMLLRIQRGEAQGIICWKLDRLARNPVDGGSISWMLQQGTLRHIQTHERSYYPSDNVLMMAVELGMANQYVRDLSDNTKRGMRKKIEQGRRPGNPPLGYRNVGEVGNRTIISDPDTFDIVRKMWDLFLTGSYSVSKIRDIATSEWGLRTRQTRKLGGKPLTMSGMYMILNNEFYCGYFEWTNPETGEKELHKGSHEAMITEQEYRRAQVLLGKKGKPQPKTREFAFTGIMHCGECDAMVTAEEKNQIICTTCKNKFAYENKTACAKCGTDISEMKNPKILNYIYYHCTKRKDRPCSQKTIRLEDLESQFNKILESVTIDEDYLKLALDYLKETQEFEVKGEGTITKSLQDTYNNCQTRLKSLHEAYISPQNADHGIYTPEEFKQHKTELIRERDGIKQQLDSSESNVDRTLELSERTFNFCTYARYHFNNGDLQAKRAIFSSIGSNLTLTDRKLAVELYQPYMLIQNELTSQRDLVLKLEPIESPLLKGKTDDLVSAFPSWLPDLDSNQD